MSTYLSRAIAALLAAGSVSMVCAQVAINSTPGQNVTDANWPTTRPDVTSSAVKGDSAPKMTFSQAPIASAATAQGGNQAMVDSIVAALNAEPSLQESKITVQDDGGNILLTGATQTRAQVKKASDIATAQAGDVKVVNTVLDSAT